MVQAKKRGGPIPHKRGREFVLKRRRGQARAGKKEGIIKRGGK